MCSRKILTAVVITAVVAIHGEDHSIKNDYIVNKTNTKAYKLIDISAIWDVAKRKCEEDGAKLAVPRSEEEFLFIQKDIASKLHLGKENKLVWLGIDNRKDIVWRDVDGNNIAENGWNVWAGDNGKITKFSANPAEPHCVGMDGANHGLRDYWCHRRQPYVCEKLLNKTVPLGNCHS